MCEAVIPSLLYYAYIPLIILSILFGVFVYFNDKENILNRLLLSISLIFAFYSTIDFLTWFSWSVSTYIFFEKLLMLILLLLPLLIYFSYNLADTKLSKLQNILILIPVVPAILVAFSRYSNLLFSVDFEGSNCVVIEGLLYPYIYLLGILYLGWFIGVLILKYRSVRDDVIKKRIITVIYATAILIIWISVFLKLQDYLGDDVLLFVPFGMILFVGILAFAITEYKLLNIKLLAAQALMASLILLVGSELFFADSLSNQILILITLAISIGFGYMLIKSVQREEERKDELQLMSDKLAQANDNLRVLDNAKTEFISIASHQLRTPLTAIKGFISLLLEGSYGKVTSQQEDVLNKVYTSNERLVNLVEDLLNVSRIESGRMEFTLAPTKVEDICQEVMDTFIPRAKSEGKYLEYKKPEEPLPEALIDGTKIREVISNLVDNALKYTIKGGVTVKIEVCGKNEADKCLSGQHLRVTVSDTGIGVPVTEMPYLFAKFSRGKDISRLNTGGTGLGLYVGKSMVEANSGKIWAESDGQGQGSRFIVELPVANLKKFGQQQNVAALINQI